MAAITSDEFPILISSRDAIELRVQLTIMKTLIPRPND